MPRSARRGSAMLLVALSITLMLVALGVALRGLGSALWVQSAQTSRIQRDQGSVQALALALTLLETGAPPTNPYSCEVTINTSTGAVNYTATYSSDSSTWTVEVAPYTTGTEPMMPTTFASAS